MKSYVLIGFLLILSFDILHSQPNVPRYENPQIEFKYTIVVGSMQKLENAEKLQKIAIENGYESFIIPVNIKNKQHYRVCIGSMQSFSESKKQLSVIKKDLNIANAWIWQAPLVTEMVKPETKIYDKPKKEVVNTTTPKEPIQKPEMKKIESPATTKTEITKPETKSSIEVAQSTPPKNDIPVTTPSIPKKSEPSKVVEQAKTEPKPEPSKIVEQAKTEPKPEPPKIVEQAKTEPKPEPPKVVEKTGKHSQKTNQQNQDKNISQQKQMPTNEPKQAEKQAPKELAPPVFISDSLLADLTKTLPKLLTNIRNYEYLQANKYIHPDLHFYAIYNEESKPSVREFNSFEKFFGVFSAFTSKGTSFDFSNDIEQMLKKTPVIKRYPMYDCNSHMYNQKGLIVSTASANNINLLNNVRAYYRSFNQELLPEISEKVSKVESRIQAVVIDTEGSFIEGLYFGYIDGKWYLLVLDIKFRCR